MIIDCNVECYNQAEVEKGAKEVISWRKLCIDTEFMGAVKEYVDNDGNEHEDKSVVFMTGGVFAIDVPYKKMVEFFKNAKMLSHPFAQISAQ